MDLADYESRILVSIRLSHGNDVEWRHKMDFVMHPNADYLSVEWNEGDVKTARVSWGGMRIVAEQEVAEQEVAEQENGEK